MGPNAVRVAGQHSAIEADLTPWMDHRWAVPEPQLVERQDDIATDYPADNDEFESSMRSKLQVRHQRCGVLVCAARGKRHQLQQAIWYSILCSIPVILYAHGYGGSRNKIMLHMERHGYGLCDVWPERLRARIKTLGRIFKPVHHLRWQDWEHEMVFQSYPWLSAARSRPQQ